MGPVTVASVHGCDRINEVPFIPAQTHFDDCCGVHGAFVILVIVVTVVNVITVESDTC